MTHNIPRLGKKYFKLEETYWIVKAMVTQAMEKVQEGE
jgi:hypothetical protein